MSKYAIKQYPLDESVGLYENDHLFLGRFANRASAEDEVRRREQAEAQVAQPEPDPEWDHIFNQQMYLETVDLLERVRKAGYYHRGSVNRDADKRYTLDLFNPKTAQVDITLVGTYPQLIEALDNYILRRNVNTALAKMAGILRGERTLG